MKSSRCFLGSWLSRKTYLIFSAGLIVYNYLGVKNLFGWVDSDFWEHLAAIGSFSRDLLNPENPFVAPSSLPTHLFTPYHLFWGAVSRLVNIQPYFLMPLIGSVNIILFLIAARFLARDILGSRKYALLIVLTMLFFWIDPWLWSGFYNFGLLPLTSPYPYWFALSISLILISIYNENIIRALLIAPATGLVFLVHPLVGSFLVVALAIKVVLFPRISFLNRVYLLSILLAAIILTFLWPYFPVLNAVLMSRQYRNVGFAGDYRDFYAHIYIRLFPSFFGLYYIYRSIIRRRLDFVTLGFLIFMVIYVANYFFFHNAVFARYIIFIAFFLQLSVVLLLKEYENKPQKPVVFLLYFFLLIGCGVFEFHDSVKKIGWYWDLSKKTEIGWHSNERFVRRFQSYSEYVGYKDIVLADRTNSWLLPGILGCKVVGIAHSNPFMNDFVERAVAVDSFFAGRLSLAEKVAVLNQYDVNYVLIAKKDIDKHLDLRDRLKYVFSDGLNYLFRYQSGGLS